MAWKIDICHVQKMPEGWWTSSEGWIDGMLSGPIGSFRMFDGDGRLYFQGVCTTFDSDPFAPLDEYGRDYGCTEIRYYQGGVWKTV